MYKFILFIFFYSIICFDSAYAQKDILWYAKPAINFNEALLKTGVKRVVNGL